MKEIREPPWMCGACGYVMDAADVVWGNNLPNPEPKEGDYSLCMNCGQCHVRHGAHWLKITAAELAEMPAENRKQVAIGQLAITIVIDRDLSKRGGRA